MASILKVNINAPAEIDDTFVIEQLPKGILNDLGEADRSSGFNLMTGFRDVGFDKGIIKYRVGDTAVEVVMD